MAVSKLIGVRFPEHLLTEVEKFGLENFPEKGEWNKTNTILHLIQKGLQSEGVDVIPDVKHGVNIEQIKKLIDDRLNERITNETQEKINSIREELLSEVDQRIKKHSVIA